MVRGETETLRKQWWLEWQPLRNEGRSHSSLLGAGVQEEVVRSLADPGEVTSRSDPMVCSLRLSGCLSQRAGDGLTTANSWAGVGLAAVSLLQHAVAVGHSS